MNQPDETVVAHPAWVWRLLRIGFPLLGAGAGGLLLLAAGWVVSLPVAPLQGLFRVVDRAPQPWAGIGVVALGAGAGLLLAFASEQDSLVVTVSPGRVGLRRGAHATELAGGQVGAAFLDGEELVLLDPAGRERARMKSDLGQDRLAAAFTGHGYRWHAGGDPYRDQYRRWVPDTPDLPPAANALLRARERALAKPDHDDAADLRAELARLGVVVRQEQRRQYWRRTETPE